MAGRAFAVVEWKSAPPADIMAAGGCMFSAESGPEAKPKLIYFYARAIEAPSHEYYLRYCR